MDQTLIMFSDGLCLEITRSFGSGCRLQQCSCKNKGISVISRDGGKWWSKDHHLVVVKIVKNVAFSLKNVKKW